MSTITVEGDKMMDLYHRTSTQAARTIIETGSWVSRENTGEVYFSDRRDGQTDGYGDAVVHVRVPVDSAELDDEFPDGERHFRVLSSSLRPESIV